MKIATALLLGLSLLLGGIIAGAYLTMQSAKENDIQTELYDAVLLQLPKKGCDLEVLRKQILLNEAQGTILRGLYQDEVKREIKKTGGKNVQ